MIKLVSSGGPIESQSFSRLDLGMGSRTTSVYIREFGPAISEAQSMFVESLDLNNERQVSIGTGQSMMWDGRGSRLPSTGRVYGR